MIILKIYYFQLKKMFWFIFFWISNFNKENFQILSLSICSSTNAFSWDSFDCSFTDSHNFFSLDGTSSSESSDLTFDGFSCLFGDGFLVDTKISFEFSDLTSCFFDSSVTTSHFSYVSSFDSFQNASLVFFNLFVECSAFSFVHFDS